MSQSLEEARDALIEVAVELASEFYNHPSHRLLVLRVMRYKEELSRQRREERQA